MTAAQLPVPRPDDDAPPPAVLRLGGLPVTSPEAVLKQGTLVAKMLADVINAQQLYTVIRQRKYVHVEGWTTCAAMLGVTAREVSCDETEDGTFTAVVELVRCSDGLVIGRASHQCGGPDDATWRTRERAARRSMAVTRATGKACRLCFSWVIQLAGYAPTPAEEMPPEPLDGPSGPAKPKPTPRKPRPKKAAAAASGQVTDSEDAPLPPPDSVGRDVAVLLQSGVKDGVTGKKPWQRTWAVARDVVRTVGRDAPVRTEGRTWYSTFDKEIGKQIREATGTDVEYGIIWTAEDRGLRVDAIAPADEVTEAQIDMALPGPKAGEMSQAEIERQGEETF